MFTLKQWKKYSEEISVRNRKRWEECEKANEDIRQRHTQSVEERRRFWIAITGSERDFYAGMPGYCLPILEEATVEGCLNWLATKSVD